MHKERNHARLSLSLKERVARSLTHCAKAHHNVVRAITTLLIVLDYIHISDDAVAVIIPACAVPPAAPLPPRC